jgi:hypothetical protein
MVSDENLAVPSVGPLASLTVLASTFPPPAVTFCPPPIVQPPSLERLGSSGSGIKRKSLVEEDPVQKRVRKE